MFGPRISDSCIYSSVDRSQQKVSICWLGALGAWCTETRKKTSTKILLNSGLENCDNVPDAGAKGDVRGKVRSQMFSKIFSLAELFSREMELGQYLASPIMAV